MKDEEMELELLLESRVFINHSETWIESVIDLAYRSPQKINEFSTLLRQILIPKPQMTLPLCLVLSFLIGILSSQSLETLSLNEINELMSYEGEIL